MKTTTDLSLLDDLKQAKKALIEILKQVNSETANPTCGICEEFRGRAIGLSITKFVDWSDWKYFSGNVLYPVPSCKSDLDEEDAYDFNRNLWDKSTEYGRMRIELTEWCLEQIEKQIKEFKSENESMRKEDLKGSIVIATPEVIEHLKKLEFVNEDGATPSNLALFIGVGFSFYKLANAHIVGNDKIKYLTPDQILSVPLPEKKKVTLELTDDQLNHVKRILEQEQNNRE